MKHQHLSNFFPNEPPESFDRLPDKMAAELEYVGPLCYEIKCPLDVAIAGIKASGSGPQFRNDMMNRLSEAGRRGAEAGEKARAAVMAKRGFNPINRELK